MKNNSDKEKLPEEMFDIKSGQVFDVPADYFEDLSDRLFDQEGRLIISTEKRLSKIRTLRPWLVAASVALLAALTWWWIFDSSQINFDRITDYELGEYIHKEIMEYDLESLSHDINDEDLYSLSDQKSENYEHYIEENLDDFDEIINTH